MKQKHQKSRAEGGPLWNRRKPEQAIGHWQSLPLRGSQLLQRWGWWQYVFFAWTLQSFSCHWAESTTLSSYCIYMLWNSAALFYSFFQFVSLHSTSDVSVVMRTTSSPLCGPSRGRCKNSVKCNGYSWNTRYKWRPVNQVLHVMLGKPYMQIFLNSDITQGYPYSKTLQTLFHLLHTNNETKWLYQCLSELLCSPSAYFSALHKDL